MAKEGTKKTPMSPLRIAMGIVIIVLQFIGLFFMAIGSPFDQLEITETNPRIAKGLCYSVWGTKECGGSHAKAYHDKGFYKQCGVFEATLKSAAAFSIIAIFAFAIGIISTFAMICKCVETKTPTTIILLFGIVASAVPFAVIAGLYNNSQCDVRFRSIAKYKPGFEFFVVSFCMEVISFVLIIVA